MTVIKGGDDMGAADDERRIKEAKRKRIFTVYKANAR
jgi:hypothetical protein